MIEFNEDFRLQHGLSAGSIADVESLMKYDGLTENQAKAVIESYQQTQVSNLRHEAYKREADALFIEWQFDQTPEAEQAWRAKVEEIKARYPKPAA